uniref:Nodulin-like domain-containing protein n=1 Tax=Opuntia streptacantha TaxID=393608 RepID=A0A7C9CQF0_OPUST
MTQLVKKIGSRPPWVGLGAAILVQFASGNPYTFPLFSPALKSVLGFSQQQITILGVAADIGENAGILPGIVCNKFHPWVVLCGGALACFSGFGLIWLTVTETIQNVPYWLVRHFFYLCILSPWMLEDLVQPPTISACLLLLCQKRYKSLHNHLTDDTQPS